MKRAGRLGFLVLTLLFGLVLGLVPASTDATLTDVTIRGVVTSDGLNADYSGVFIPVVPNQPVYSYLGNLSGLPVTIRFTIDDTLGNSSFVAPTATGASSRISSVVGATPIAATITINGRLFAFSGAAGMSIDDYASLSWLRPLSVTANYFSYALQHNLPTFDTVAGGRSTQLLTFLLSNNTALPIVSSGDFRTPFTYIIGATDNASAGFSIEIRPPNSSVETFFAGGNVTPQTITVSTRSDRDLDATGPDCGPCQALDQAARGGGATTWNAELLVAGLQLHDRPAGYRPPTGPAIDFELYYSHRDSQQPATFGYSNLGPKWTHTWLSYVVDSVSSASSAKVYRRGGGAEPYSFSAPSATASQGGPYSQAVLTRTVDATGKTTAFTRTQRDGSSEEFKQSIAGNFFLTAVVDPHGNRVTLVYDTQGRLTGIKDAIGQVSSLSYGLSSDPLKITSFKDPFGRSATFAYTTSGQLQSVTDTIGLVSSYVYGSGNFISSVTTPYGTTRFAFGDSTTDGSLGSTRWLTATDPLGGVTRVEYNDNAPGIAASEAKAPSGMTVSNAQLNRRNTFVWTPYQYQQATASGGLDYTKAKVIHWLTQADGSTTSRVPESIKEPLQSRVWMNYAGQSSATTVGTSNAPTLVGRVLDDGSTQLQAFQYNAAGNITSSTDPIGRKMSYVYATNGIDLLSKTNTTGGRSDLLETRTYDTQHNVLTVKGANGRTTTFTYNAFGQPKTKTDAINNTTTYSYDANGYLTSVLAPQSLATYGFTYDAVGRVASKTDAVGTKVSYAYDDADRLKKITYPDGTSIQMIYDNLDVGAITDRKGQQTTISHDALRRTTQTKDPLARVVAYAYFPDGSLASITDQRQNKTSFGIDLRSRPVTKTYADGTVQTTVYEGSTDRVAQRIDALGQVTNYGYFVDDTLASITYTKTLNATPNVSYTYDPAYRRVMTMTDGIGVTSYSYGAVVASGSDDANLLIAVSSPVPGSAVAHQVSYSHDGLGRVKGQGIDATPAMATSTEFDALGRIKAVTNALDSFSYAYSDGTPRVAAITSKSGPKVSLDYFDGAKDELLKTMTYTSSAGVTLSKFTYDYDANQNVTKFGQSYTGQQFAATALAVDDHGNDANVQSTAGARSSVASAFPAAFPVFPRFSDALILLLSGALLAAIWRIRKKLVARLAWPTFPVALALGLASCGGGGGSSDSGSGGSSGGGGGTTLSPTIQFTTYSYDQADRLTSGSLSTDITPSGASTQSPFGYAYDNASNLTSMTEIGATRNATYAATNAIGGGIYDGNGSPTSLDGVAYSWDAANRLVKIVTSTTVSVFTYDGQSRLVRVVESQGDKETANKSYLWCGSTRCLEYDNASGTSKLSKQYLEQGVVSASQGLYYVTDRLGSVRQLVDSKGAVQAQYDFAPYGTRQKINGTQDSDVGFTGLFHHSASGRDFALYRAYGPDRGRWLNRDPIEERGGINLFEYGDSQPTSRRDPSGLDASGWSGYPLGYPSTPTPFSPGDIESLRSQADSFMKRTGPVLSSIAAFLDHYRVGKTPGGAVACLVLEGAGKAFEDNDRRSALADYFARFYGAAYNASQWAGYYSSVDQIDRVNGSIGYGMLPPGVNDIGFPY